MCVVGYSQKRNRTHGREIFIFPCARVCVCVCRGNVHKRRRRLQTIEFVNWILGDVGRQKETKLERYVR